MGEGLECANNRELIKGGSPGPGMPRPRWRFRGGAAGGACTVPRLRDALLAFTRCALISSSVARARETVEVMPPTGISLASLRRA
jgi:hypothetical protein